MNRALVLAVVLSSAAAYAATQPAVAVMPFSDLSGGKGKVGEAIRETVTTDLKDVAGLAVDRARRHRQDPRRAAPAVETAPSWTR